MAIKTITITEDAYNCVSRLKHENESFSKLFLRLGERKLQVKDLIGAIKITEKEAKEWQEQIGESRENLNKDMGERYAHFRQLRAYRTPA